MQALDSKLNFSGRIIGLDAMRALLALLGFFLHAALSHLVQHNTIHVPWYTHSSESSYFFNYLVFWIHSFRMPAFFFLSGFLSFCIYKKYNLSTLAINRLKRIVIPFWVIWITPIVFGYTLVLFIPQVRSFITTASLLNHLKTLGPFWFLYYLLIIDTIWLLLLSLIKMLKTHFLTPNKLNNNKHLTAVCLMLLPFLLMCLSNNWLTPTKISIIPSFLLLSYYGSFFLLGWLIQTQFIYLIRFSQKYWPYLLMISFLVMLDHLFLTKNFFMINNAAYRLIAVLFYNISSFSMLFALLGICLSFFKNKSGIIQYLADSSYWMYIAQVWIILYFEQLFESTHLAAINQYLLTVTSSLVICLLTYQLFIRNKRIFRFIDGTSKKYTKKSKILRQIQQKKVLS